MNMVDTNLLFAPPPAGVECECYEADGHFHSRFMGATCDYCEESEIEGDFHVFTRAAAYEAIAAYAESLGWSVNRKTNVYRCAECRKTTNGV